MKRWHLTLGLTTTAILAAVIAPRLQGMLAPDTASTDLYVPPPQAPLDTGLNLPVPATVPLVNEGPLVVTASLDREAVLQGVTSERFLTVQLQAPARDLDVRAPVNVAVVMDTSGSMQGQGKIRYAREATKTLIRGLGPDDVFSLVTFNDDAHLAVPATSVRDRDRLERQVDRVYEGGGTNLFAGIETGRKQLNTVQDAGEIGRLIILSDGKANVGVTHTRSLARLAEKASAEGIAVSAMGLGLDFNEDLLAEIADLGGGTYVYIDDPQQLRSVFAAELDQTTSVIAAHTTLDIVLPEGVAPVQLVGWDAEKTATGWRVFVGDIPAGTTRKIVTRVRVDGATELEEAARVTATYTDLSTDPSRPGHNEAAATVRRTTSPTEVEHSLNAEATAAANRAWGNRFLELSTKAYEKGDQTEAIQLLERGSAVLEEAALSTGDAQLQQDVQHFERQKQVYGGNAPRAQRGRHAIKSNKEFIRDAYR